MAGACPAKSSTKESPHPRNMHNHQGRLLCQREYQYIVVASDGKTVNSTYPNVMVYSSGSTPTLKDYSKISPKASELVECEGIHKTRAEGKDELDIGDIEVKLGNTIENRQHIPADHSRKQQHWKAKFLAGARPGSRSLKHIHRGVRRFVAGPEYAKGACYPFVISLFSCVE